MQLKNIKLSGFKSFVDSTNIPIRSNMTSIVGPNGCGKSNVIDAVRWVIGETSAKQLRGQSMTDVIFNGTTSRKPIGKASVELVFDNSDGRIVGEYAAYTEIAIRREVERNGQSSYFLNGTHCRRRDIIDLFLGTGLGPRSYSIIEQGMVASLVEAKPEEMRNHLEEAAGISKYKERRRETENRIKRTNENLDRLNDLQEELSKQQRHLKRQANAAERYKELKQEERLLQAQVKALQWQALDGELNSQGDKVTQHQLLVDEKSAQLQHTETEIEKARVWQAELAEKQNTVQKEYYGLGAEIARIEQQIQNVEEQTQRWKNELQEADGLYNELTTNSSEHREQQSELNRTIETLAPQSSIIEASVSAALDNLQTTELNMNQWQEAWDAYQQEASETAQERGVANTKLEHYRQRLQSLAQRISNIQERMSNDEVRRLQDEVNPLAEQVQALNQQLDSLKEQLDAAAEHINTQRQTNQHNQKELEQQRQSLHQMESKYASLDALQQAALGMNDDATIEWVNQHHLTEKPRLGKEIQVTDGWETAVEAVLSGYFDTVCVDDIAQFADDLQQLDAGKITLMDKAPSQPANISIASTGQQQLIDYVTCDWSLGEWLQGILVADNLQSALAMRAQLTQQQSIITKDGIWVGPNWVRVSKVTDNTSGVLQREQDLQELKMHITSQQQTIAVLTEQLQLGQAGLAELEQQRDMQHQSYQELSARLTDLQSQLSSKSSRLQELQQQQQRLQQECDECLQQQSEVQGASQDTQSALDQLEQKYQQLLAQKEHLQGEREAVRQALDHARDIAQQEKQKADELEIRLSSNESQLSMLQQTISHAERQLTQLTERRNTLTEQLSETGGPLETLSEQLQTLLSQRMSIESRLNNVENEVASHNQNMKELDESRHSLQTQIDEAREQYQQLQLHQQTLKVQLDNINEYIAETDFELETLTNEMPEEANIDSWQEQADRVTTRINRLGPINLAAIDEYKTVTERKEYLDAQQADLQEALEVLQNAIRKIDKETRAKFRETYDKVNNKFKEIFPRIFGGGRAELELLDDDLLTAGVLVRAQPPGKKNSTIHMLSGGEKALTAISLVFSLFHLNPAPFCILDEVDAPLDDVNVGRFCQIVKEMSQQTQFIIISHNKVTIESANHLMGVTMQEAGVSRIVSVDMDEAVEMAIA